MSRNQSRSALSSSAGQKARGVRQAGGQFGSVWSWLLLTFFFATEDGCIPKPEEICVKFSCCKFTTLNLNFFVTYICDLFSNITTDQISRRIYDLGLGNSNRM